MDCCSTSKPVASKKNFMNTEAKELLLTPTLGTFNFIQAPQNHQRPQWPRPCQRRERQIQVRSRHSQANQQTTKLWRRAGPGFWWRTTSQKKRGRISQKKVTFFSFRRREENYLKAKELLDTGDEEGYKKMAESIDISPDMAYHLII